ncbi:MAG: T9SS C-terminal target domain-containing protein [Candidatus Kapaibacterium sp.]|nr:MAG: T9SS C-terminal target domain-containing protein [Candidatus Kapabacteria bacterium]
MVHAALVSVLYSLFMCRKVCMKIHQIPPPVTLCKQLQNNDLHRKLLTALVACVLLLTLALPRTAHAQVVTTLAGDGTAAFLDGTGTGARLNGPLGVCSDGAGNLFVADQLNHRIRRIVIATGVVTTLAGDGTANFLDGTGTAARFNSPWGICSDGAGNLFVAEQANHRIRRIVIATGVVTTLAGNGTATFLDGTGTGARFNGPLGVCSDGAGNLFVADHGNNRIRRIVIATGVVTTLAGNGTAGFLDGTGTATQFAGPPGICSDGAGNLFVADWTNHRIRQIVIATGVVTTLAGDGTTGFLDGTGTGARFNSPYGVCTDGAGNLIVADWGNGSIRRIAIATGVVTTVAGNGTSAFLDGTGSGAQFNQPTSLCIDGTNTFVADYANNRIRRISPLPPPPPPVPPPPPAPPTLAGGTFSASIGIPFGNTLSLGGNPAPSLSVTTGALPPGIILDGNRLTGIPTVLGIFTFTLTATNSEGTVTANVTITVGQAIPQITAVLPPNGSFGSTVTITGFNLDGATAVTVGGVPVQSFTASGTTIIAVLGAPGNSGTLSVSTPLGNTAIGGFSYEPPPVPVLGFVGASGGSGGGTTPSSSGAFAGLIPPIPTGDSNVTFFLPGQNIPSFANISITPISSSGATTSFSTFLPIVAVSATGATVLIPSYALLPSAQRLSVRVGDVTVSTTFAIVRTSALPAITGLSVGSTTASGAGFATIVSGTGFFRNGLAKIFVNDEESYFSQVLSSTQAQVHIPAHLNVRRGTVRFRIQNLDGQSTSGTVEIIGRAAPLILSATPKRTSAGLSFIVRGVAFSPRLTAILGRRSVQVVNASDIECEVLVPSDFALGGSATVLLTVSNPDGQRHGLLISGEAFSQGTASKEQGTETSTEAALKEEGAESASLLRSYPNPATETVSVEVPASLKARRYSVVNALGEEVVSGTVQGNEALVLDVRRLVKGLYTVRVVGASRVRAAQVIVR